MKNDLDIFKATAWAIIILALTIFTSVFGLIVMRVFTKAALSDNAANVINGITENIGVGLISVISLVVGAKIQKFIDSKM